MVEASIMCCSSKTKAPRFGQTLFLTPQWEPTRERHSLVTTMALGGRKALRKKFLRSLARKTKRASRRKRMEAAKKGKQKIPPVEPNTNASESSGNKILDEFGIDLGIMGNDIYDWLWPKPNPTSLKRNEKKLKYLNSGGYLPSTKYVVTSSQPVVATNTSGKYNAYLHRYILHNYAQERITRIYKRLGFHMRLSPRILAREVAALTGKFGMNILQPEDDEYGTEIRADVQCLRRVKAKVYCLLGLKLMKYHLLFLLRYIRLGIPPEIRDRYISNILTRSNISRSCDMICTHKDPPKSALSQDEALSTKQESALKLTYPDRLDFDSQGYPYSDVSFYDNPDTGWSPSQLVVPAVFKRLSDKSRCKLVYISAALHPEYCLQLVKNVAFCAGYKCERELLLNFCLHSQFGSRGAKNFVSKLKEEHISNRYIQKAARLVTGSPSSLTVSDAMNTLLNVPIVSGLMKRHLESGHKMMPINTSQMIFKRIRRNTILKPEDLMLWDIAREAISRRVPHAPLYIYRQVRMELFAADTYIAPTFRFSLERRGIDTTGLYDSTNGLDDITPGMDYAKRRKIAKQISRNLKKIWLNNSKSQRSEMDRVGLEIIDAMAATTGYESFNNVLILVTMLSEKPATTQLWRCQQPGPEFEHSTRLEVKDFKYKLGDSSFK